MVADNKFPRWLLITLIVFGILMMVWQMLVCGGQNTVGDTSSYCQAWYVLSHQHIPDAMRPPFYPIFIGICFELFGQTIGRHVILASNWAVWIAGCWATWHIMRYFNVGRKLRNAIILSLLFFSGSWIMNNMIHPEPFAMGGIQILILLLIRYRQGQRNRIILVSGAILYALIFLKPQFVYLVVTVCIAWLYITFRDKKELKKAIWIPIITIASLSFYAWCMHHFHRSSAAFSIVSQRNNYYSMRMAGLIHLDEIQDPDARQKLESFIKVDPGVDRPDYFYYWTEIDNHITNKQVEEIWQHAYSLHTAEMNRFILHRFPQSLNFNIFFTEGIDRPYDTNANRLYHQLSKEPNVGPYRVFIYDSDLFRYHHALKDRVIFPLYGISYIPFWVAWLSMFLFTAVYLVKWWQQKRFPVVEFLIASTLFGGYITAIVFAPCDWGRLVTPYTMTLFVTFAVNITNISNRIRKATTKSPR